MQWPRRFVATLPALGGDIILCFYWMNAPTVRELIGVLRHVTLPGSLFPLLASPPKVPASRTNNWKTRMLIDLNARLTGYLERGEPTPLRSALSKLDLEEISRLFDEIDAYDAAAVLRLMPTRRRRACLEACSMETRRLIALVFPRLTGSQKQ